MAEVRLYPYLGRSQHVFAWTYLAHPGIRRYLVDFTGPVSDPGVR